jgi:trehalose synthase
MLHRVRLLERELEDYRGIVQEELLQEIEGLSSDLRDLKVLEVNSTAKGGGVAELLTSLVPLMRAAGIEAEWEIIFGDREFFGVTKAIHNALQGQHLEISEDMREIFEKYSQHNAEALEGEWDVVIVNDPQPVTLPMLRNRKGARYWVWRCHIDTTEPNPEVIEFLSPYLEYYDACIFTHKDYKPEMIGPRRYNFAPAIDPLLPKNETQDEETSRKMVADLGIDTARPLMTQVARFDPWKDPVGAIEVYKQVKEAVPGLQLALVGTIAGDDPQGWDYYERTARNAGLDYDIHILQNFEGIHQKQVNAFQDISDVIIQMSKREGFGLTVTEAMWKGNAVVASRTGGITLQIVDGETGYMAKDRDEFAERVKELLGDKKEAHRMGERAVEAVRKHFLTPRLLRDYLAVFRDLTSGNTVPDSNGGESV